MNGNNQGAVCVITCRYALPSFAETPQRGERIYTQDDILLHAIKHFGTSVYRLAYSQLRSHHSAEDIYQETFAALYQSETVFDDDFHMKSWLLKVALNKCRNVKRKSSTQREELVDPQESRAFSMLKAEEPDGNQEAQLDVWEMVGRLDESFREVVHLYYHEGFSTDEIAAITEVPSATVRSRLHRARAKLKEIIEAERGLRS